MRRFTFGFMLALVCVGGLVANASFEGLRNRHAHHGPVGPGKPQPRAFPGAPASGPAPVLVESDKPDVPSAWGMIEATSHEGWYAVDVRSRMCAAYRGGFQSEPNETHIVAQGPKGLKILTPVFVRHDHATGRWHVMYYANAAVESSNFPTNTRAIRPPSDHQIEQLFPPEPDSTPVPPSPAAPEVLPSPEVNKET